MITLNHLRHKKMHHFTPTRIIVLSFFGLILLGTSLLMLPFASNDGMGVPFIDALFTATSASCITGLVVYDTKDQWSLFGQLVILFCVQVGGIGIVTLATFFTQIMGKKIGLQGIMMAQESLNFHSFHGVTKLIKKIILVMLLIEIFGALILSIRFVPEYGMYGIYLGVFHAISAFCNSGFDLFGNFSSLAAYNSDPVVLFTIGALIIVGGLGFIVWKDLYDYRNHRSMLLHTKVVLSMTIFLLIFGSILIFLYEFRNPLTMGNFNLIEKVYASIFQSISARTAGYSSIALNEMNEITKVVTILLMFIGAAPGSTGGGIKVTTLSIILVAIWSQIRGENKTIMFRERILANLVFKSLSIVGLGLCWVLFVTTMLLALETKFQFIDVLYEATSAFSTTGGSSIGTQHIQHPLSKILLILTMFIGRVGPLSFAIAIALRKKKQIEVIHPEGKVVVG